MQNRYSRIFMIIYLFFSDLTAIFLAGSLAIFMRIIFDLYWWTGLYYQISIVAVGCILAYIFSGLYPAIGINPVDELRKIVLVTTVVVFGMAGLTFFARNPEDYSRLTIGLTWLFSLGLIPFFRTIIRRAAGRFGLWGEPVAIVGMGEFGKKLMQHLIHNKHVGYKPALILDDQYPDADRIDDIPIIPIREAIETNIPERMGIRTALMILPDLPESYVQTNTYTRFSNFKRLLVIPNQHSFGVIMDAPKSFAGVVALEVRQNLASRFARLQKRTMDLVISFFGLLFLAPIFAVIGLLIKFDSTGIVFYQHIRIGKDGKRFGVVKFRTMREDANQVLEKLLREDDKLKREWDINQKIKDDPRITRVGKFLRKTSLDELPQLWNVIRGEMSLVGPRPIVEDEIKNYGEHFKAYEQVLPGITGFWQVSGRNDTSYDERVVLDEYYVRNWSIWFDIYILMKTVWVVLRRDGAY
jgi:Undecaprenyl-phosphate galactose phosphotransferase WbaP